MFETTVFTSATFPSEPSPVGRHPDTRKEGKQSKGRMGVTARRSL